MMLSLNILRESVVVIDTENTERAPLVRELPLLHQIYKYIASTGEMGVSQIDIQATFAWAGVGKLEARQLCRNLERRKVLKKIMQDQGKQRVQRLDSDSRKKPILFISFSSVLPSRWLF